MSSQEVSEAVPAGPSLFCPEHIRTGPYVTVTWLIHTLMFLRSAEMDCVTHDALWQTLRQLAAQIHKETINVFLGLRVWFE